MDGRVLSLPRSRQSLVLHALPSGRAIAAALAAILIAGGLYGLARETSMFAIDRVRIEGASPVVAAQARSVLRSFEGTNLLSLNGAAVIRKVESLPAVRSATYDRAFPHTLRVRIVPEQPVAVLRRGVSSWLVSARARVIASVDPRRYRALPRIWLRAGTPVNVGDFLDDADGGLVARALAGFASPAFARRIAWARSENGSLRLGLRGGLQIVLGSLVELRLKIAIAETIIPALRPQAQGGPAYLDVSVPDRPVAGTNTQPGG